MTPPDDGNSCGEPNDVDEDGASDAREADDTGAFPPPAEPTSVCCLHCGQTYCSSQMRLVYLPDMHEHAWCCATEGCDGVGFCFDVWPTDPEWRDEYGELVCSQDDDDDEFDDDDDFYADPFSFEQTGNPVTPGGFRATPHDLKDQPEFWKLGDEPPPWSGDDIPF